MKKKIYIGSDHGGFSLKSQLIELFHSEEFEIVDLGVYSEESVDYPDIAQEVCHTILENPSSQGILICGTGIGISIAANKVNGIRAALCCNEYSASMAKKHNNANVLCMGGRVTGSELALSILHAFLNSSFEGGRHQRRIDKLEK